MRSYKYTIYIWYDNETDGLFETDSFYEFIKKLWKYRNENYRASWFHSKRKGLT